VTIKDPTPPPVLVPGYTVTLAASLTSVPAGGSATLTATVTAVNGAPPATSFAWDCDGNGTPDATTTAPTNTQVCTYPTVGTTTSKVKVTGGAVTGNGTTTVTVTELPPPSYTVSLAATPSSVSVGGSATLVATVTRVNGAPAATSFAWDCDGTGTTIVTNGNNTQPCTYSTAGTTTSKVTVTGGSVTGNATTAVTVNIVGAPVITVNCGTATLGATPPANRTTCNVSATLGGTPIQANLITITAWGWGDNTAGATGTGAVIQSTTYTATSGAGGYHVVVSATVPGGSGAGIGTGIAVVQ